MNSASMMKVLVATAGMLLLVLILWDAFEAIILPRRVTRKFRLARMFYRSTWAVWSGLASHLRPAKLRESCLSTYGPLSMLMLLGVWASGLIFGFALIHRSAGGITIASGEAPSFFIDVYWSGTTFFTLGLGDIVPRTSLERVMAVLEAGTGFGFLALVIGYLPILYQGFSRREVNISLLDARAGSPPTAWELLRRHGQGQNFPALAQLLHEWERWSAELLETHLSYPVLSYFRSQHDNQSWLAALTAILDTCALGITGIEGRPNWQARLTFAMARHAAVDLAQIFSAAPRAMPLDRLPKAELDRLRTTLAAAGVPLATGAEADRKLTELRLMYEPYVHSLADYFKLQLPPWIPAGDAYHNWRTSAWQRSLEGIAATAAVDEDDEHM
jgi:hypothetical protein